MSNGSSAARRARSNSIVKVEEVGPSTEVEVLDQSAFANMNVEWVNYKGAWMIHLVLILTGKMVLDTIPGMTQEMSWTFVNLLYLIITTFVFHWATGVPFQGYLHGGAYDELTLWEQIDEGAQYTPAKKWLISVPILLFLISTHYTQYNPWIFAINITALIISLVPKLPQLHRQRVRFLPEETSGMMTPVTASGSRTPIGVRQAPMPPILTESHFRK